MRGDPQVPITGIRALEHAGPRDLSFFTHAAYRDRLADSRAGAVLISEAIAAEIGAPAMPLLVAGVPALALARLIPLFHPETRPAAGIHATAIVGEGCEIDAEATVGPYVVIGDDCRVGPRAVLHSHVVIGRHCHIGAGTVLHPQVVLYDRTELGERVILHAGVVLGADGFGYATHGGEHVKVPQVGKTVIEDDVEIGASSAVDRGALEETRIGAGTKIDNLVQVGHNVEIGRGCILSGQAGIAGSARLSDYVVVAGQGGVAGHLEIGEGSQVAAKSAVLQTVPAGRKVAGIPAFDLAQWRRAASVFPRLGELVRRIRRLEKQLEKISRESSRE